MCGIFGFIGVSKQPRVTHRLMTALAEKTETRGKEATGFWGAAGGSEGGIIYHKEPVKSTDFVKGRWWKRLEGFNPVILLGHCREPSKEWKGHDPAPPKDNRNNHPHVSDDCLTAVVHNGKVDDYQTLVKGKYQGMTQGRCDSELVLKMFQIGRSYHGDEEFLAKRVPGFEKEREVASRLLGVTEIFNKLNYGAMAIAVGERMEEGRRVLWLMRDEKRTLVCVDLQETLGIIVFASTKEIFKEAVESAPEVKQYVPLNRKVVEFPSFYAYRFELDTCRDDLDPLDPRKFRIHKTMVTTDSDVDPEEIPIPKEEAPKDHYQAIPVLSGLDADENVRPEDPEANPLDAAAVAEGAGEADAAAADMVSEGGRDEDGDHRGRPAVKITREEVTARQRAAVSRTQALEDEDEEGEGHSTSEEPDEEEDDVPLDSSKFEGLMDEIDRSVQQIRTNVHNLVAEGSLRADDLEDIMDDMKNVRDTLVSSQYVTEHGYH